MMLLCMMNYVIVYDGDGDIDMYDGDGDINVCCC